MSKFNSKNYWENRYRTGGSSGAGSHGDEVLMHPYIKSK